VLVQSRWAGDVGGLVAPGGARGIPAETVAAAAGTSKSTLYRELDTAS